MEYWGRSTRALWCNLLHWEWSSRRGLDTDMKYKTIGEISMKIKKITSQNRRDFTALYECEHCGHEHKGIGYDDTNFHQNVIPKMECPSCGQIADETYRPLATKYSDDQVV